MQVDLDQLAPGEPLAQLLVAGVVMAAGQQAAADSLREWEEGSAPSTLHLRAEITGARCSLVRMGQDADPYSQNPPSPVMAGLWGRCPRCGKGKLFAGFLALAPRCEHCGLDFSFADSADGPAFFVMFISGFIVAGSALAVEIAYAPPYWVHAVLWIPLILITTLLPLRPMKGLLIALQYHHKAAEGRFTSDDSR